MELDAGAGGPVRRRSWVARIADQDWLFAVALALAVGVLVWFGRSVKDFFAPSAADVLVPAFAGQTQTDAMLECGRLRLRCVVVASQPSDRYPKDVVMSQAPDGGSRAREGRQISLVVSTGVVIFPMPDLRFESARNAALDLNRLKLQLEPTTVVANDDIPANHVVSQQPPPLTSVRQGTKVTLALSKGPPGGVKVPNFAGLSIDDARDAAQRARISLGQVVWTPFGPGGPARGQVVRQNPTAGTEIDPFAQVSLQVSAGPTEYGYLVRQVHVSATVPTRYDAANVRLQVRDQTGTWNVYDGFAQGGQKFDFNLTVVGTAELETYINNELLNQTTLGQPNRIAALLRRRERQLTMPCRAPPQDRPVAAVRRLRRDRGPDRDGRERGRRRAAPRFDGRPLRSEPDLGDEDRQGSAAAHDAAVRLSFDDRRTGAVRRRLSRRGRRHHHLSLRSDAASAPAVDAPARHRRARPASRSTPARPSRCWSIWSKRSTGCW